MSSNKNNHFLQADEKEIRSVFLKTAIWTVIYTIIWIPVYLTRCFLVRFVKVVKPNYGKILDEADATLEEDYSLLPPANSLKFTLVLDLKAPLQLQALRKLFTENVLEAKVLNKVGLAELRYPELKQYQTDFAGYRFWKNDEAFHISNHVKEEKGKFNSLSKLHQNLTNKTFPKRRSPWELFLIQNYQNDENKALLVFRSHHTLGDTKSIMKLLIEGLAQKGLKQPNVNFQKTSFLDKIQFYVWLPFYFVYIQVMCHFISIKAEKCPWKSKKYENDENSLHNLAISKKILMNDVKTIAKRNNVTASAVIMAAVAGGAGKSDKRFQKSGIPMQYVLPKEHHPEKLANHNYSAVMDLPTDIRSPMNRLSKCELLFKKAKASNLHVYEKWLVFQLGTWFQPLRTFFLTNTTFPLIVTNIAGDTEGFSVGDNPCSQFTMTCCPLGACGVIICAFSYKDGIEISVTAKNEVLSEGQTQKLTELIEKEFEILKKASE